VLLLLPAATAAAACCVTLTPAAAAVQAALPGLLPRVSRVAEEDVQDSWELLEELAQPGPSDASARSSSGGDGVAASDGGAGDDGGASPGAVGPCPGSESAAAAAAFGRGRLAELRWIIWPRAPREVGALIAAQCPKVALNPMPRALLSAVAVARAKQQQQQQQQQQQRLSGVGSAVRGGGGGGSGRGGEGSTSGLRATPWDALDPMCALDEPLAALAGPSAFCDLDVGDSGDAGTAGAAGAAPQAGGCDGLGDKLGSIAERFRQAYIDQERRLRERDKRAAEVLRRRALKSSPALRAYEAFFDDGPAAI
jgi:hypothetical protein